MPTINFNRKKKTNKNNKIYLLVYNTYKWHKKSENKLISNPVCEICNLALATEVHHRIPISTGNSDIEMIRLAFDENNLISICNSCHKKQHKRK